MVGPSRSVNAVLIATTENRCCPPGCPDGAGRHASLASAESHSGCRGAIRGAVEIYQSGLLCPPGPGTSVSSPKALVLAGLA